MAHKKSKMTYALVALAVVALVAISWAAYQNPPIFRADFLKERVGVKMETPKFKICGNDTFLDSAGACSKCGTADCSGLVSYWKFDEAAGLTANDSIGPNNGTLQKMTATTWVSGKKNGALNFDGITDFVRVPNNSSLNLLSGSFTISAWIKIDTCANATPPRTLLQKTDVPGDSSGILYYLIGGGTPMGRLDGNNQTSSLAIGGDNILAPVVCNAWNHIVWSGDKASGVQKLYMNGIRKFPTQNLTSLSSMTFTNTAHDLFIGMGYIAGTNPVSPYKGSMDELTLWNRALSESEVRDLNDFGMGYICGNGITEAFERCDDGNTTNAGTCNATCSALTTCGDGTVQSPNGAGVAEVCDAGTHNGETSCASDEFACAKCNATCTTVTNVGAVDDGSVLTLSGPTTVSVGQMARYKASLVITTGGSIVRGLSCMSHLNFNTALAGTVAKDADLGADDSMGISFTPTSIATSTIVVRCPEYTNASNPLLVAVANCGNGTIESGETCDDGAANGTYGKCNTACTGPGLRCGDGVKNGTEECDGTDFGGKTCADADVVGTGSTGTLSCSTGATGCTIVKTACSAKTCANLTKAYTQADAANAYDIVTSGIAPTAQELAAYDFDCSGTLDNSDVANIFDNIR